MKLFELSGKLLRVMPQLAQMERLARGMETEHIRLSGTEGTDALADLVAEDEEAAELATQLLARLGAADGA